MVPRGRRCGRRRTGCPTTGPGRRSSGPADDVARRAERLVAAATWGTRFPSRVGSAENERTRASARSHPTGSTRPPERASASTSTPCERTEPRFCRWRVMRPGCDERVTLATVSPRCIRNAVARSDSRAPRPEARLDPFHALRVQPLVGQGHHVAHPERAVELVQCRGAERAVGGARSREKAARAGRAASARGLNERARRSVKVVGTASGDPARVHVAPLVEARRRR